jgi:hypothetical protein
MIKREHEGIYLCMKSGCAEKPNSNYAVQVIQLSEVSDTITGNLIRRSALYVKEADVSL